MKTFDFWALVFCINFVFVIIFAFVKNSFLYVAYVDFILVIFGVIGFYFFFFAAKKFEWGSINGKVLYFLSLEALFLAIGDFLWFYLEVYKKTEPFPSIADFFYIIAYVPAFIGLIIRIINFDFSPDKNKLVFYGIIFVTFSVFSLLMVIFPIIKHSETTTEMFFSVIYPILDVFLVALSLLIASYYSGGKLEIAWLWVAGYNFVYALADTLFAFEEWQHMYSVRGVNLSDFLYVLAPSLAILAAIKFLEMIEE